MIQNNYAIFKNKKHGFILYIHIGQTQQYLHKYSIKTKNQNASALAQQHSNTGRGFEFDDTQILDT